ncbi:complement C1q-like protein 3 [Mya arenaria]|uniref:complement C1q-like protein 3 n=1 Tax=Mya arenaria TaxID=6604 RepID=UPI0022DF423B|nr:complement C1q-like protein 3 [Mya arenaria]
MKYLMAENKDLRRSVEDLQQAMRIPHKRSIPESPVAFSAKLSHNVEHAGIDQTVIFDSILLNEGGHYNPHTGVFRVPVEGIYLFNMMFADGYEPHRLWMRIVVDGQEKVAGVADTLTNNHDMMGGNLAILHLHPGDSVWVATFYAADVKIYGRHSFTTFSGVLLYQY